MRRRQAIRRGSANRRKLVWSDATGALSFAAADNSVFDLLAPLRVAGASVLGATVMRTHIRLVNTAATITRGDQLVWGLLVGESQDVGLNIAGAPNANAEPMLDWAMHPREWATFGYDGTSLGAYDNGHGANKLIYDVRSKRKVQEMNQSWHLVMTQSSLGTAGAAAWLFQARTLLALP